MILKHIFIENVLNNFVGSFFAVGSLKQASIQHASKQVNMQASMQQTSKHAACKQPCSIQASVQHAAGRVSVTAPALRVSGGPSRLRDFKLHSRGRTNKTTWSRFCSNSVCLFCCTAY